MRSSSGGKFELKMAKNCRKECFIGGAPQGQKLHCDHDSYVLYTT